MGVAATGIEPVTRPLLYRLTITSLDEKRENTPISDS
jgi:hypothetical protein